MKSQTNIHDTKVLFVITKSNWGGAQAYVYELAKAAKEAGADVSVALGGTGGARATAGALSSRLLEAGIRVIPIHSFARDISFFREWRAFFELLSVIRAERPDVLHVNSSKAGGIGALAGRLLNVRHIIFTAHGWPHKEPRNIFSRILIWLASYATVLLCHTVIVLSETQKENAPAPLARRKLFVIPNGIENFQVQSRERARAAFIAVAGALTRYPKWILSTSEMNRNKGLETLIDAFASICHAGVANAGKTQTKNTHKDTALVLSGDGEEREALATLTKKHGISNRVFFVGFIPNVREVLSAADIFVLPSHKEGLPFGLLEAGNATIPVIASNVGGIPDIIKNNVTGILVPPGKIDPLAEALITILDDSARAKRLADALHKYITHNFSYTAMIEKTLSLYENTRPS